MSLILTMLALSACSDTSTGIEEEEEEEEEITQPENSNWITLDTGTSAELNDIFFIDENIGWAAGNNALIKTEDGGDNWTLYNMPYSIWQLTFVDANTGWAATSNGFILHTTDGGETWSEQGDNFNTCLVSIDFVSNQTGWVVGCNGIILSTTDGGLTWDEQSFAGEEYYASHFFDETNGVIIGYNGSLRTTSDGGTTWTERSPNASGSFSGISFIDSNTGWAGGHFMGDGSGTVIKTTDGGESWTKVAGIENTMINDIYFLDNSRGWVVGQRPTGGSVVYYTTDGGDTWTEQIVDNASTDTNTGITFMGEDHGWISGYNGKVHFSATGGIIQ
ncbi:MAG: YCF48-related protein [Balneolaceae bacterium]|nr:YCF48-related protein [Balneolaceae bacterium]